MSPKSPVNPLKNDADGDGLNDRFDPYILGTVKATSALVAIVSATLAAIVETLFGGIGAIWAGIVDLVTEPIYAIQSFVSDVIASLFGLVGPLEESFLSASAQLFGLGPLAYLAGIVLMATMLYVGYLTISTVVSS